jgi:hypothetical protein
MDIQQQLDSIQSRNEKLLKQTPAEYNAEKVNKYYQEFLQAKTINDTAPNQLKDAEDNYYKARFGDKYMDVLEQKYTAESKDVLQSMMDSHQEQLKKLDDKIKTHSSSAVYLQNIDEVKRTWEDKIKNGIQQIKSSNASLNNRNTFYTDEEQSTLMYWILFENCFILSFVVVTIVTSIMGKRDMDEIKVKAIGSIALLCIVFFMNTLLSWLRYLPKSLTFYTQWGYDPMESKVPWVLVVLFTLFGILCIVYVNSIKSFLKNMKDRLNGRPPTRTPDARYQPTPYRPRPDARYRPITRPYRPSRQTNVNWRPSREELQQSRQTLRRARF